MVPLKPVKPTIAFVAQRCVQAVSQLSELRCVSGNGKGVQISELFG